jgi:hypothetical protein
MPALPPEIAGYPVQHLPILTAMDVDAGTLVLGRVLDTLSGRSPLYR